VPARTLTQPRSLSDAVQRGGIDHVKGAVETETERLSMVANPARRQRRVGACFTSEAAPLRFVTPNKPDNCNSLTYIIAFEVRPRMIARIVVVGVALVTICGLVVLLGNRKLKMRGPQYRGQGGDYWREKILVELNSVHRLTSSHWEIPSCFIRAGMLDPEALPMVLHLLNDADSRIRVEAMFCIQKYGPVAKDATDILVKRIEEGDYVEKREGIKGLGSVGPGAAKAIPFLTKFSLDPTNPENLRKDAINAIERIEK
jgi:hypothetical protein